MTFEQLEVTPERRRRHDDVEQSLGEAIDWILRVTGKDGQGGGNGNETHLAQAVANLPDFNAAIKAAADKQKGTGGHDLSEALERLKESNTLGPIVKKLAEGLGTFIGYQGGQGIANVIDPLQQLRKGVLMFLIEMINKLRSNYAHTGVVDKGNALNELSIALNKGMNEFDTALEKVGKLDGGSSPVHGVVGALKNIADIQSKNNVKDLADGFQQYLTRVLHAVSSKAPSQVGSLKNSLPALVKAYGQQTGDITPQIQKVESANSKLSTRRGPNIPDILTSAVHNGTKYLLEQLKKDGYKSTYQSTSNWNGSANDSRIGQIFLGCLPLYYQALTYIYWGCHEKGGGWKDQTLANGAMRSYFDSQGLLPLYVERSKTGAHIADGALKGFSEFQAAASSLSSPPFPYASFTNALMQEVTKHSSSLPSDCPLSALFYGASCYFRCQQMTNAKSAAGAPKTIREMLYFLAALQFSSAYEKINGYIGTLLNQDLKVADSSKPNSGGTDTLSADQVKGYFRASCAFSSSVLGVIQGSGATEKSEPWLHELFCNSTFNFKYPSGAALFSTVSNYAYACQFQLLFLYSMCGNIGLKCGWQECTYGKEMNPKASDNSLQSHICQGLKCNGDTSCKHNGTGGTNCNHNNYSDNAGCGKGSNPSPPGVSHWNASVIWP
ncbi:variant erythrocyte surface antigen-1 family protein [Babesia caballi]|uniref:Variant erythrocyte surface antigen-1 family protein n=1 Tax=Babesia caballi TaxID=5871 RepID=A0AAV4LYM4_BABCB|nr:variant erythrocyte surface antigen-1 family protein [Babesia caballi]